MQNSCLFCKKKHTFSILHTHFYKTPTSVYLFYHLFYLNNNISLIFYYIKQTTTHMAPSTFFLYFLWEENIWESNLTRREKKEQKNHLPWTVTIIDARLLFICKAVLYICTLTQVMMWVFFGLKYAKLSTFCILQICGCSYPRN